MGKIMFFSCGKVLCWHFSVLYSKRSYKTLAGARHAVKVFGNFIGSMNTESTMLLTRVISSKAGTWTVFLNNCHFCKPNTGPNGVSIFNPSQVVVISLWRLVVKPIPNHQTWPIKLTINRGHRERRLGLGRVGFPMGFSCAFPGRWIEWGDEEAKKHVRFQSLGPVKAKWIDMVPSPSWEFSIKEFRCFFSL